MRYIRFLTAAFVLLNAGTSPAQEHWTVSRLAGNYFPESIVVEKRRSAPGGVPDSLVETHTGEIASAWYGGPTARYGHGILGDAIEASALNIAKRGGAVLSLALPETEVFEDRYPRLADLDGDGQTEIVTIRSSVTRGASVTVYGIRENRLVLRATTGFIGLANRWLNIAGIADFRGTGRKQIAFVRTPHIGGTLFFYEFDGERLKLVGSMHGFSNHVIGSREMRLSATADINGDGNMDLVLPSDSRRRLRIVGFGSTGLQDLASVQLPGRIDKAIDVRWAGRQMRFVVGLDDGIAYDVYR